MNLAGLLAYPVLRPSHPEASEQWQEFLKTFPFEQENGLTAAGTAPEFSFY
ncbi:hypothetical protein JCM15548_13025 [Geofilum rubicundum JCM 15548]|uniref:Uncharacterized protein n=1 Tax=Geofilum rubicundum JCM 15548 TaxID=1236989 RepID=A0A0E9LZP3_9BACT|nr:hypothetical protein JCM15548_13025 [Geofilum rubicundum JCM 15548]